MTAVEPSAEQGAGTVTLEFSIQSGGRMRSGFATDVATIDVPKFGPGPLHARGVLAEHLDSLPLCWVADGKRRGATVEEWEVSFDHDTLPSFFVVDDKAFVTCDDCKEWLHA